MRKVLVGWLAILSTMMLTAGAATAQEAPTPSCTVQSVDGLTVTIEIADMRPYSAGEVSFFNGEYYYDENGNLIPNPFTYLDLENGTHEFALIPGEWTVTFAEWTNSADGTPGFIIGWGCDLDSLVIGDVDPADALEQYLSDLLGNGSLSSQQYNQLITQFAEAQEAITAGENAAAIAHLNNLTRRADHKMFDLEADEVVQIESYVAEIIAGLS